MARFRTKVIIDDIEPLPRSQIRFVVGLDLSVTSPGCAIFDLQLEKQYICAFAQKAREDVSFYYATENANVFLLDVLPKTSIDVIRYLHTEKHLITFIKKHIPEEFRREHTDVHIEQYAFAAPEISGNSYKLMESGGIIKRALFLAGFEHVTTVVSGSWKRTVVGKGDATKLDVVHFVANHIVKIDFLRILGFDETTLTLDEKGRKIVPCPAQDLADACAIAMSAFLVRKPKAKQLKEEVETRCAPGKQVGGIVLPLRKVNIKKRKPKPLPQQKYLIPRPETALSFWATKQP